MLKLLTLCDIMWLSTSSWYVSRHTKGFYHLWLGAWFPQQRSLGMCQGILCFPTLFALTGITFTSNIYCMCQDLLKILTFLRSQIVDHLMNIYPPAYPLRNNLESDVGNVLPYIGAISAWVCPSSSWLQESLWDNFQFTWTRAEEVSSRLWAHEHQLTNSSSRISAHEYQLANSSSRIPAHEYDFANSSSRIPAHEYQLTNISSRISVYMHRSDKTDHMPFLIMIVGLFLSLSLVFGKELRVNFPVCAKKCWGNFWSHAYRCLFILRALWPSVSGRKCERLLALSKHPGHSSLCLYLQSEVFSIQ